MSIKLSDHFTAGRLILFALPSIGMMIFTSIYCVVDGFFVSNYAGKDALAAVNLAFPIVWALSAFGFMFGTGGAARVAKTMGEGDDVGANRLFTFIFLASIVAALILTLAGILLLEPILGLLGAEGDLLEMGLTYGHILSALLVFWVLQNMLQSFFIAAEKPNVGLVVTIVGGVANIVGDYVLIGICGLGVAGAALATAAGQMLYSVIAVVYFATSKTSRLRFARPHLDMRALGAVCVNGSSELVTEIASSVVGTLYNYQLMNIAGADGVAAYGVIMYVNFIFAAILIGYATGTGPIVSFHFGAGNKDELKGLLRKSLAIIVAAGVAMFACAELFARPLVGLFVSYDADLLAMTLHGFRIYSFSFLICGFNIYGSAFFTALNNGKVSALISFSRTFVLETASVMLLPLVLGIDGVWCAVIVAEACAFMLTVSFLVAMRKKYGYA